MAVEIQQYIGQARNKAVEVLRKHNLLPKPEESQLVSLLEEVKEIDEAKVLAIASTVQYASSFNQLVREKTEEMRVADRYNDIANKFSSVRDDAKKAVDQLADGVINWKEKLQNIWMKTTRGSIAHRFDEIKTTYTQVEKDVKAQLDNEKEIMGAYVNFRLAVKSTESIAYELLDMQQKKLEQARAEFSQTEQAIPTSDQVAIAKAQLARDIAKERFEKEDHNYQLIKDIAENLKMSYSVGDVLVAKLKQTHKIKERVYDRGVTFFTLAENIFTTMATTYTSQLGLNEATKATEALGDGMNKGLEQIAEMSGNVEKQGIKVGYGSMYKPESVQKLVDAVVSFQTESYELIAECRKEATQKTGQIASMVEAGGKQMHDIIVKYATKPSA